MKTENIRLSRAMPLTALIMTALSALSWTIHTAHGGEVWFTLALTFTATAYHFVMRLCVGFAVRPFTPRLNPDAAWFAPRAWEAPLYRALRVKTWKAHMPTYVPGSFSVENLGAETVIKNMCSAEITHEIIVAMGYATLLLALLCDNPAGNVPVFALTAFLAGLFDTAFVIMQRYNRPRVKRILELDALRRERRRARAEGKHI